MSLQAFINIITINLMYPDYYGQGTWHIWRRGEVHTGFWWGDLRERDHLEDLGICGIISKWILEKLDWRAWTGVVQLRM
jgi:hypothetical protein